MPHALLPLSFPTPWPPQLAHDLPTPTQLISLFSVGYAAAVEWLGPLEFTRWQWRCYQLTRVSSWLFQCVFFSWFAGVLTMRTAFPLAMTLAFSFFAAFNATNLLILAEPEDDLDPEEQQEEERLAVVRGRAVSRRARFC